MFSFPGDLTNLKNKQNFLPCQTDWGLVLSSTYACRAHRKKRQIKMICLSCKVLDYISTIIAVPIPPPMQRVARPL